MTGTRPGETAPGQRWEVIDSHAHLAMAGTTEELRAILSRAAAEGITEILSPATKVEDLQATLDAAAMEAGPRVWAAVGIHPHEARSWSPEIEARIEEAAAGPRVVAIGETGLDYHYDFSPRASQREAFARQVRLAARLELPIIVHCREAPADIASILAGEGGRECGGVIHCFTESAGFARQCLDLGFYISFSGILTFRDAGELREVARGIPPDRLLVETDSPYLAPVPHRGKRNEPRLVRAVLEALAEARGEHPAALAGLTSENFRNIFRRRAT